MTEKTLRFDAAAHRYYLDPEGVELPSVTHVLKRAGLTDFSGIDPVVLEAARVRGTAVHRALHMIDDGELLPEELRGNLLGYVEAYQKFSRDTDFVPELVEHRAFDADWRFAGTIDRTGTVAGTDGKLTRVILDIKTGAVLPAHRLQLVAYATLLPNPRTYLRIALQLFDDGIYKMHAYRSDFDLDQSIFIAALGVEKWKMQHGL